MPNMKDRVRKAMGQFAVANISGELWCKDTKLHHIVDAAIAVAACLFVAVCGHFIQ